jgi:integrase
MKDYSKFANTGVASRTNAYTNKRLRKIFERSSAAGDRDLTCKTLRSVYAYIAYRLYGDDKISEILYGAKILGHNDLDTNTFAQSYNHIFVKGIEPKSKTSNKEVVKGLIEELSEAVDKL